LNAQKETVLFLSDKIFVDYTIPGGVQLCTHEFIEYLETAGYTVKTIKVNPTITFARKVRKKLHIEAYELYDVDDWLTEITNTINADNIKLVFFNQVNLAHWSESIKRGVPKDVKFIGLSHGNESGDYLHDITQTGETSFLKTWRLGKLIVKEKAIFSRFLDGVITISDNESYIDQWLGAQNVFYLPRILKQDFIDWQPVANTIGFVGTLNHLPNQKGVELLSDELQKLKFKGILKLVGGPEYAGKALEQHYAFIKYCGSISSEQLVIEAGTWGIFLNPVFWYARGSSTKLSQALSWGLPVASTLAGIRGYDLVNNAVYIDNNRPAALAKSIVDTLASAEALKALKDASVDNVMRFDRDKWTTRLRQFLVSLKELE
jgi:hypothetical protein